MGRIGNSQNINYIDFKPSALSQFDPYTYTTDSVFIDVFSRSLAIDVRRNLTGEQGLDLLLAELRAGDQTKVYWLIEEREDLRAANPVKWTIALELSLSKRYIGIARHMMEKQKFSEATIRSVLQLATVGRISEVNAIVNPRQERCTIL